MVAGTQNSKAHRHDLRGSVRGAEADLKVTALMTINWAGIGGAKERWGRVLVPRNHVSWDGGSTLSGGLKTPSFWAVLRKALL